MEFLQALKRIGVWRLNCSTFCIFQVRTLCKRKKTPSVSSQKQFLTVDVKKTGKVSEHVPKEYHVSQTNNKIRHLNLAEVLSVENFFWSHWEMLLSEFLKIRLNKDLIKIMLDYHIQITILFNPESFVYYLAHLVLELLFKFFIIQWQDTVSIIYKIQ